MRSPNIMQRSVAEALGAFILVFVGSGTATAVGFYFRSAGINVFRVPGINLLLVALGLGLALFIGIMVVGKVSGGHFNPAVTLGLAAVRRFEWADVPGYVVGQVVGAVLGALCILLIFGPIGAQVAGLGAPRLLTGTSIWQGLVIEGLGTAVLVLVIMGTAVDTRAIAGWAPLAIGLTLTAIILFIGVVTGGSVNPVRAFGPDLVATFFGYSVNWAAFVVSYLIGPLIGGVGAAYLYTAVAGLPRPTVTTVGGARPQAGEEPTERPGTSDVTGQSGLPATS